MILLLFMHIVANYFVVSGFPHLFWPLLGLLFARVKPAEKPVRVGVWADRWSRRPRPRLPQRHRELGSPRAPWRTSTLRTRAFPLTGTNGRPQVSFLAWSSVEGRSRDIAAALGGEARCYYALRVVRSPLIPLRYSFDAVRTAAYLLWRRPRAVIVTNPPIFPVLLAIVYGRLTRAPIVLDSHPAAFGRNGSRVGRLFSRFHARVARRAVTTLVPADDLREEVESWGARADVLHEAPPLWYVAPPRPLSGRPRVLLVGILARDEPLRGGRTGRRKRPRDRPSSHGRPSESS